MAATFLTVDDLVVRFTRSYLVKYFDDDNDGVVDDDDPALVAVLEDAEGMYYSRILRSLSMESALLLVQNDPTVRGHVAWIACELASERRTEFTAPDGKGAYWTQYSRGILEIDLLSRARTRSQGEAQSGALANSGGTNSASLVEDPIFSFAPSRRNGPGGNGSIGGQGGFAFPLLLLGGELLRLAVMHLA